MKLFLTEGQIKALLDLAQNHPRDHALFHVALCTGFRVSDLSRIKRDQVIDSDGQISRSIRTKMKKTGVYIDRPLRLDCRESIARYIEIRKDNNPFLFRAESNNSAHNLGPLDRSSIHRIFQRYLRKMFPASTLRGNSCHVTRRSVAKLIAIRTGRVEPAASFLGHKSITSTMSYIDMDGWQQKAEETLEDLSW